MGIRSFLSQNMVFVVVIPLLIGSHYGWMKLQEVDELVSPEQRKNLAVYSWFHRSPQDASNDQK